MLFNKDTLGNGFKSQCLPDIFLIVNNFRLVFCCYSLELSYKLFFSPDFSSVGFEFFIDNLLKSKKFSFFW